MRNNRNSGTYGPVRDVAHDKYRRSTGYDNRGYHGEPPDQRIPSRYRYQRPAQDDFYRSDRSDRFGGSQTSLEMHPMGHYAGSQSFIQEQHMVQPYAIIQGNVPYVIHPAQYVQSAHTQCAHPMNIIEVPVPSNQDTVVEVPAPSNQEMVRDTSTPIPSTEANNRKAYSPQIACIIFKRILSALSILFDICFNWLQYASLVGHFELPFWLNMLDTVKGLRKKDVGQIIEFRYDDVPDDDVSYDYVPTTYIVIFSAGTAYGLLRIVNMIGETIIEYNKHQQKKNKAEASCRGFQFMHGWIETMLGLLFEDLPQVILMLVFTFQLGIDYIELIKFIVWARIKTLKNGLRLSSCKQKYKPCCNDCCKDCCVFYFDFTCCCRTLIFRACACCGNDSCLECQSFNLCPERQNGCCGEIEKDPNWALRWYEKVQLYYEGILVSMIGKVIYPYVIALLVYIGLSGLSS